eukprot:105613-Pelagomonas_calceolata.AAC.4
MQQTRYCINPNDVSNKVESVGCNLNMKGRCVKHNRFAACHQSRVHPPFRLTEILAEPSRYSLGLILSTRTLIDVPHDDVGFKHLEKGSRMGL